VTTWGEIAPALASEHTVVVPDLRGSGTSEDVEGDELELTDIADDLVRIADMLGLQRFDVVGFSLGSAVALTVAAAHPDRVGNLVLIGGATSGTDSRSRLQFELWADLVERDPELFSRLWLLTGFSAEFLAQIPPSEIDRAARFPIEPGTARQSRLNARIDLSAIIEDVRARTLVVGCAADAIMVPARARELADGIASADYAEVPGGHMAVLEQGALLTETITAFLAGSPAEAPAEAGSGS